MCAVGIPHDGIATCIQDGIDEKTLRKYFDVELKTAKVKANAKVGGSIFNAAMGGNMVAATLWAKTQMGWKETSVVEADVNVNVDLIEAMQEGRKRVAERSK